jgi:hypothetical protein
MYKIPKNYLFWAIVLSVVCVAIFYFVPAVWPNGCVPPNSFLDPTGIIGSLLLKMSSPGFIMNCTTSIVLYTSPFFYFFTDLTFLLLLFAVSRILFKRDLISQGFYRLISALIIIFFLYIFVPTAFYIAMFVIGIVSHFIWYAEIF